eukprot:7820367-Alexandrium_andersonii.AAC.1
MRVPNPTLALLENRLKRAESRIRRAALPSLSPAWPSAIGPPQLHPPRAEARAPSARNCLLYTSDAADDM